MEASNTGLPGQPDPTAASVTPQIPHVETPPQTPDEILALAKEFAEYRKEVAALREELAASRKPRPQLAVKETENDRLTARLEAIAQHEFYCPGCGKLVHYQQQCIGTATAPHPAIEVVSTSELSGDPAHHTAAPDAAPEAVVKIAA